MLYLLFTVYILVYYTSAIIIVLIKKMKTYNSFYNLHDFYYSSDVIEKLSIIKTCTKNTSCYLQKAERQMTKDLDVTCDSTQDNWICTDCCYDDGCNISEAGNLNALYANVIILCFVQIVTSKFLWLLIWDVEWNLLMYIKDFLLNFM